MSSQETRDAPESAKEFGGNPNTSEWYESQSPDRIQVSEFFEKSTEGNEPSAFKADA